MRSRLLLVLLAANLVLLAGTVYLLKTPDSAPATEPALFTGASVRKGPEAAVDSFSPDRNQSQDFPSRIAKLRAMKYPEEAIRKIVGREIANTYRSRERQITEGAQAGKIDSNAAETAIAGLEKEKEQQLGDLNGDQQAGSPEQARSVFSASAGGALTFNQGASGASGPQGGESNKPAQADVAQTSPARLPAALVPPDPNWQLNDQQTAAWQQIQNQFAASMAGGNQDPSSPEYLKKWQTAQWQADQFFKTMFGAAAYNAQSQAAAAAQNAQ